MVKSTKMGADGPPTTLPRLRGTAKLRPRGHRAAHPISETDGAPPEDRDAIYAVPVISQRTPPRVKTAET